MTRSRFTDDLLGHRLLDSLIKSSPDNEASINIQLHSNFKMADVSIFNTLAPYHIIA